MIKVLTTFLFMLSAFSTERVISTVPSLSEILYELKLEDKVVGVSKYCSFNKTFCSKTKVGTSLDLSYEKLMSLNPSVVLLSSSTSNHQIKNLSRLGLKTILLEHDRLVDIYNSINTLGKYFSRQEEALKLTKRINNSFINQKKNSAKKKVLFLISSQVKDGEVVKAQAAGSENFYSDILDKIGVQNILDSSPLRYPEVGREKMISLKYDYIIEIFGDHNISSIDEKKAAWVELKKSRSSSFQYIPMVGNYLFVPGPGVWKIAEELRSKIGMK